MHLIYQVPTTSSYHIVLDVLMKEFHLSHRLITKLKQSQHIFRNNTSCYTTHPVSPNDLITVDLDFIEDHSNIVPTPLNLDILYEDDAYLIINKPAHMPVHPSSLHFTDSLSNGISAYFDTLRITTKNPSS